MGYGANKNKIISFIKYNKLNKNVKVLNFHKNNPFIKDQIYLFNRYEGLLNVFLEAQTLKKFIISSNCKTGPREILQNGKLCHLFKVRIIKCLRKKF